MGRNAFFLIVMETSFSDFHNADHNRVMRHKNSHENSKIGLQEVLAWMF